MNGTEPPMAKPWLGLFHWAPEIDTTLFVPVSAILPRYYLMGPKSNKHGSFGCTSVRYSCRTGMAPVDSCSRKRGGGEGTREIEIVSGHRKPVYNRGHSAHDADAVYVC